MYPLFFSIFFNKRKYFEVGGNNVGSLFATLLPSYFI